MCLSTVYRNERNADAVVMKNVVRIDCDGDTILLTDLMERQLAVHGKLLTANLVEGWVVVQEES